MFYSSFSRGYGSVQASLAQADAAAAASDAREAQTSTELMKHDINRLLMITEALWMLLKQQHGYTDDDLKKVITEIDLRDGVLDGKSSKAATVSCPGCGRPNSTKHALCIYCGKPIPTTLFGR